MALGVDSSTASRTRSHVSPVFVGFVVGCVQPIAYLLLFLFGGMADSSGPAPGWGLVAWWVLWFPALDLLTLLFGPPASANGLAFALCFLLDAVVWGIAASAVAYGLQKRARRKVRVPSAGV